MSWWVGPFSMPEDLPLRLERHGMTHLVDLPGMAADLTRVPPSEAPPGLTVHTVRSRQSAASWSRAFAAAFGLTGRVRRAWLAVDTALGFEHTLPWQRYLGLVDGTEVATAALFLGAGVAGIYAVGTVPSARGRGIAGALVTRALQDAQALGYQVGILHSTASGERLYRRLGFQELCRIGVYLPPGQTR